MRGAPYRIDVGSRAIDAELFTPAGDGPFPAVLLLHELFGLDSHVRADARSLADEGFLTLAPDLYTALGRSRYCIRMVVGGAAAANRSDSPAVAEVGRCVDALRDLPGSNGRIGVIGMCLTGGFALQMARRDDMAAPVVFHHSFGTSGSGLPDPDAADVRGPVLGHFVAGDPFCPQKRVRALKRQLGDRLVDHHYQGVGHGLRSVFRHTREGTLAWDRTLAFFRSHLM